MQPCRRRRTPKYGGASDADLGGRTYKPSWEKAATIIRERYDPEIDGRILLAKKDCTEEVKLCRSVPVNYLKILEISEIEGITYRDTHQSAFIEKGVISKKITGSMIMNHIIQIGIQRVWSRVTSCFGT